MKNLLIRAVKFYQKRLSPLKPRPTCRFYPTCSSYAIGALEEWGTVKGGWMALCRILRCQPLFPGGFDPVKLNPKNHPDMIVRRVPGFLARRRENASTLLCLYYAGRQRTRIPDGTLSEKQESGKKPGSPSDRF